MLVFTVTVSKAQHDAIYCWDGMEVDERILEKKCGITEEEYLSAEFEPEDCPEAAEAIRMVGGCETDWPIVWVITARVMVAYLMIAALFFFTRYLIKRWS
jgi:hypothetical protein